MTDVIRREQNAVGPIRILATKYANTRNAAKQHPYEQSSSTIKYRRNLHALNVLLF